MKNKSNDEKLVKKEKSNFQDCSFDEFGAVKSISLDDLLTFSEENLVAFANFAKDEIR